MRKHFLKRSFVFTVSVAIGLTQAAGVHAAITINQARLQPVDPFEALLHRIQTNSRSTPTTSTDSSSSGSTGSFSSSVDAPDPKVTGLGDLLTSKISRDFDAAVDECRHYEEVYRIDCLRQNIELIAKSLPTNGAYRDAKQILLRASRKLETIVRNNVDASAPTLTKKPGANRRFKKRLRYRAVKKEKLAVAMSQARAVIEEARTELLRSAENSEARLAHYQSIATAVGSTKVLLRSA